MQKSKEEFMYIWTLLFYGSSMLLYIYLPARPSYTPVIQLIFTLT